MEFSVIIPIYNVERYLRQCVDSVLAQDFEDYEVILVDDGSPDRCPVICDEYADDNINIKVVHQANGGLSDARNSGLAVASGEYVVFLDSDDYWADTTALSEMHHCFKAAACDTIMFGCFDRDELTGISVQTRGKFPDSIIHSSDKSGVVKWLMTNGQYPGAAWILAVKRSLLLDNDISFVKGNTAEDYDWVIKVLKASKKISLLDKPFCIHRINVPGSITSSLKLSGIAGMTTAINNWVESPCDLLPTLDDYLARVFVIALSGYTTLSKRDRKIAKQMLKSSSPILNRSNSALSRSARILLCIFGYAVTSKIIHTVQIFSKKIS